MLQLTNSKLCADLLREIWNAKIKSKECTYIIYLNDRRQRVFHAELCTSKYKDCLFDIREAVQYALNNHLDYIIIAHNHTGDNPEPCEKDIRFTVRLKSWLAELQIVLVDHIVLTYNDYYSFADNGLLKESA